LSRRITPETERRSAKNQLIVFVLAGDKEKQRGEKDNLTGEEESIFCRNSFLDN